MTYGKPLAPFGNSQTARSDLSPTCQRYTQCHPFLDRFAAAAKAGFRMVEYLSPYAHDVQGLAGCLKGNNLQLVLFNAPSGGADAVSITKAGLDALTEPVVTHEIQRFFLSRQDFAHESIYRHGAPSLKVQMNRYYYPVAEGDVVMKKLQIPARGLYRPFADCCCACAVRTQCLRSETPEFV